MITVVIAGAPFMLSQWLAKIINGYDGFKVVGRPSNAKELKGQFKKNGSPDVLLLDTVTGRINGVETIFWMEAAHPSAKIILIANLDSKLLRPSLARIGVHRIMTNDMSLKELKKMLLDIKKNTTHFLKHNSDRAAVVALPVEVDRVYDGQETLSRREFEFIYRCCSVDTLLQISVKMNLRLSVVKKLAKCVFAKTGVETRRELIVYAVKNGLAIYEAPVDI